MAKLLAVYVHEHFFVQCRIDSNICLKMSRHVYKMFKLLHFWLLYLMNYLNHSIWAKMLINVVLMRTWNWNISATASVLWCVRLESCACTCLLATRGSEGTEAPAGLFSTKLSPWRHQSHYTQQPSTDRLHSAAVLEIEFFLSPTGTNHIAFTLFIPLFCHTHVCRLTETHTGSCSFTLMWMLGLVSAHIHTLQGL